MVFGKKHGANYLPYTNVQKADAVVTSLATYAPAYSYISSYPKILPIFQNTLQYHTAADMSDL